MTSVKAEAAALFKAGDFAAAVERFEQAIQAERADGGAATALVANKALALLRLRDFRAVIACCNVGLDVVKEAAAKPADGDTEEAAAPALATGKIGSPLEAKLRWRRATAAVALWTDFVTAGESADASSDHARADPRARSTAASAAFAASSSFSAVPESSGPAGVGSVVSPADAPSDVPLARAILDLGAVQSFFGAESPEGQEAAKLLTAGRALRSSVRRSTDNAADRKNREFFAQLAHGWKDVVDWGDDSAAAAQGGQAAGIARQPSLEQAMGEDGVDLVRHVGGSLAVPEKSDYHSVKVPVEAFSREAKAAVPIVVQPSDSAKKFDEGKVAADLVQAEEHRGKKKQKPTLELVADGGANAEPSHNSPSTSRLRVRCKPLTDDELLVADLSGRPIGMALEEFAALVQRQNELILDAGKGWKEDGRYAAAGTGSGDGEAPDEASEQNGENRDPVQKKNRSSKNKDIVILTQSDVDAAVAADERDENSSGLSPRRHNMATALFGFAKLGVEREARMQKYAERWGGLDKVKISAE